MGKAHTVKTELGEFTAKELTVGQVRDVLENLGKSAPHIVDMLFDDEGVPGISVSLSTGLPLESEDKTSLLSFSTSDMRKIIHAVKEVNPDFLDLAGRLRGNPVLPKVAQGETSTAS